MNRQPISLRALCARAGVRYARVSEAKRGRTTLTAQEADALLSDLKAATAETRREIKDLTRKRPRK